MLGVALWVALLLSALSRPRNWSIAPKAAKNGMFLVALVALASLMPVDRLPRPLRPMTFGLGALSSVFDNIPLTAMALKQGGYDWAMLAYAVSSGGSLLGFVSRHRSDSALPERRVLHAWLREGWHVAVAYLVGFAVLLVLRGRKPG